MANSKFKINKTSHNDATTKSVKAQTVVASQSTEVTDKSSNSGGPQEPVKGSNCVDLVERLKFRYPRNHNAREALRSLKWTLAFELHGEGLPIPPHEALEELTARWLELQTIVARENATPEEIERARAFLKEFLILASAPDRTPAAAESEAA
jgi:hypothetical protein